MCSKGTFTPVPDKQCVGLHEDTGAKSAAQCENNCCEDDYCIVWQFSDTVSRGVRKHTAHAASHVADMQNPGLISLHEFMMHIFYIIYDVVDRLYMD